MLYPLLRPAIFALDAERAHGLTLAALQALPFWPAAPVDPRLASTMAGLHFPGPVGLAPGFDKNAQVAARMFDLGFGFVEIGTVTPLPQAGNDRPRLFRLGQDHAVINRMGFNNDGADRVEERLKLLRAQPLPGPLGANIGANKDSANRIVDYAIMAERMAPLADYLTVNISSPNTPGLRALQDPGALDELLAGVMAARGAHGVPVFLKLAPDLAGDDIADITRIAIDRGLAALIISNTTITRPALQSQHAGESGGLSGAPLRDLAHQRLIDFRRASGGAIPLIGVGGIASADHAWARIRAGACLVQIYSAMVYEGPGLAARIHKGLIERMERDGFSTLADAVGVDA